MTTGIVDEVEELMRASANEARKVRKRERINDTARWIQEDWPHNFLTVMVFTIIASAALSIGTIVMSLPIPFRFRIGLFFGVVAATALGVGEVVAPEVPE